MSSRIVDLKDLESIEVGMAIIDKIIKDIKVLNNFIGENELLKRWLDEIEIIYHKYNKIENSLFKKFYNGVMKTQMEKDFLRCFEIEEKVSKIVADVWHEQMSDPDEFINGDDFKFVVHATRGLKKVNDTSYICCSLITNNHIITAYSKLCLALNIDENNFICANGTDCATVNCDKNNVKDLDKIKCVNKFNDQLVITHNCTKKAPITKIVLPSEVENVSIENTNLANFSKGHNEIVLKSSNLKVKAIILISNGCDLLFDEYKEALKLKEKYNVDIKVINKSLYRRKNGLSVFLKDDIILWEMLLEKYNSSCALNFFKNMNREEIREFLDKYYNDIVIPGNYDKNIQIQIDEIIENLKISTKRY